MTGAWMIYALAIGALIAIAAVSAEWILKSAQRPVRYVWVSAIALTVMFTVVAPLRVQQPTQTVSRATLTLPAGVSITEHQPTRIENVIAGGRQLMQTLVRPMQTVLTFAGAAPKIVDRSATIFWVTSSIVSLLVLVAVYARSIRESSHWPRMRVLGKNVRVAPDVGPAVIGMAPPEIVIPRWVLQRHPEEQRLVLEHEAEHVRAHDPILLVFACVAVALMPWHAALWFMWSRLRLAVELDCDSRVLKRGALKTAYGELLVELSSQRPWDSLAMPAFSWGSSHLEKRLVAMTARPARFTVARRTLSVGVVGIALLAACQSELPTAAQIASMDASAVATRLQKVSDSLVYFVDEKVASPADAKSLLPGDIGKIEILKKNGPRKVSEIHITKMTDSIRVANDARAAGPLLKVAGRRTNDSTFSGGVLLRGDSVYIDRPTANLIAGNVVALRKAAQPNSSAVDPKPEALLLAASNGEASVRSVDASAAKGTYMGVCQSTPATPCRIQYRRDQQCDLAGARARGADSCEPLIFVNGKRMESAAFQDINPDRIESIEVVKGAAAITTYGQGAINGVISIKLKN